MSASLTLMQQFELVLRSVRLLLRHLHRFAPPTIVLLGGP